MGSMGNLTSVLLSYENLIHAVSGAAGSTVALSIFYPLDVIRTYQQVTSEKTEERRSPSPRRNDSKKRSNQVSSAWIEVAKDIVAKGGVGALYNGMGAVNKSVCVSNFVYFYVYHALKKLAQTHGFTQKPVLNLVLGMLAGTVNVLATTPLWVANTRIKLQGTKTDESENAETLQKTFYKGLIDCMVKITKEEGVRALWSGTLPSLILVFNPAIHWAVYETLKSNMSNKTGFLNSALYLFLISAMAKCVASITTYPLQLLQNRLRAKWYNTDQKHLQISMIAYFRNILKTQGVKGLFRGLEVKLWQTVLTAAFMFVIYEKINARILRLVLNK